MTRAVLLTFAASFMFFSLTLGDPELVPFEEFVPGPPMPAGPFEDDAPFWQEGDEDLAQL